MMWVVIALFLVAGDSPPIIKAPDHLPPLVAPTNPSRKKEKEMPKRRTRHIYSIFSHIVAAQGKAQLRVV